LMGGTVWVESALGRGSSFHFTAGFGKGKEAAERLEPQLSTSAVAKRPAELKRMKKLRVLLAEDNAVNQKIACRFLEKEGHDVTLASDGRQALAALDRETFDVVLMDIQMPEMDGFEATTIIRAGERDTGKHLPIIAMTAHAMKGDRERCLAAGMDSYLAKPIAAPELIKLLEKFSDAPQGEASPA
jgi:CheY-like chemotaxis protein